MKIWKYCLIIGCCVILAETSFAQNIIVNGGFEDPLIPANTTRDVDPAEWSRIITFDGSTITHLFNGNGGISEAPTPHGGNQQFFFGFHGTGISQNVRLKKPDQFRLAWWTSTEISDSTATAPYTVRIWDNNGSSVLVSNRFYSQSGSSWTRASAEFYLPAGSYVVEFRTAGSYYDPALFLDDVTMMPVADSALPTNQGHHQSGITGQVVGLPTFIHQCHIGIVSSDGGKVDADIITDTDLRFQVALKPGIYTLVPYVVNTPPLFIPPSSPVVLRVDKKDFNEAVLIYTPRPQ